MASSSPYSHPFSFILSIVLLLFFFSFNLSFLSPAFFSLISATCLQFIFYFFVMYSLVLFFRFYFFWLVSTLYIAIHFPLSSVFSVSFDNLLVSVLFLSLSCSGISVFNFVSIVFNGLFEDSPYSHWFPFFLYFLFIFFFMFLFFFDCNVNLYPYLSVQSCFAFSFFFLKVLSTFSVTLQFGNYEFQLSSWICSEKKKQNKKTWILFSWRWI